LPGLTTVIEEPEEVDHTELLMSPLVPGRIGQPEMQLASEDSNEMNMSMGPGFIVVSAVILMFAMVMIVGSVVFCVQRTKKRR